MGFFERNEDETEKELIEGWATLGASMALIAMFTKAVVDTYHRWLMRQQIMIAQEHTATVAAVEQATREVHQSVQTLAEETARAQRLAIWVGVGTATLGAILGGFAGAVAARIIG